MKEIIKKNYRNQRNTKIYEKLKSFLGKFFFGHFKNVLF